MYRKHNNKAFLLLPWSQNHLEIEKSDIFLLVLATEHTYQDKK